ncbi:MAG: hypothetical protein NC390_08325 [Fusobacterium sp.]|nr:hypothetical protein [Fusobacterium sp.]
MAEILLSLTIIGVVAAITLPSLTGNINERTWNTQRKALYARMSQAIALMPALNGFGKVVAATSSTAAIDTATETFITDGLSKVMKINNICSDSLEDCGIVSSFTTMNAGTLNTPADLHTLDQNFSEITYDTRTYKAANTKAAAFETQNGESIIAYYNPSCLTTYLNEETVNQWGHPWGFNESTMCVNFIYDLNGTKGPNTVGKDIGFITVFNATDSIVVAPMPSSTTNAGDQLKFKDAAEACTSRDSESRLPNINELSSMYINGSLIGLAKQGPVDASGAVTSGSSGHYWSGNVYDENYAWGIDTNNKYRTPLYRDTTGASARCVKR